MVNLNDGREIDHLRIPEEPSNFSESEINHEIVAFQKRSTKIYRLQSKSKPQQSGYETGMLPLSHQADFPELLE
ncbi:hypothetical protein TNCV_3637441 [Trichonephila clavipes]|nr:hypothetical protein TNCV_3637441 [Trichonephila clavipes]